MKLKMLLLLLCFAMMDRIQAQCLPQPADECTDIVPLVCDLDGYCGTTQSETATQGTINCGAFGIDLYGLQVIQFVATDESISIEIDFDDCNGVTPVGSTEQFGMAVMLLPACPFDGMTAFACDQSQTENGELTLSFDDAIIGEYYTLAFTGVFGNVCSFEIDVINGADEIPGLFESGNEIEGASAVCPNDVILYLAPEVDNAEYYLFSLSTGQFLETDVPELEIEWSGALEEDSVYTLCVSAFNQCESLIDYACIDVTFGSELQLEIEMELCPGESFEAFGNVYPAPGEYVYESNTPGSCDTTAFIFLEVHPAPVATAVITNDDGSGNGSIDVTVTGDDPFSYAWSNGSNDNSIFDLTAGFYVLTVTDDNGCETEFDFEVLLGTASLFLTNAKSIPVSPNPAVTDQPIFIQSAELDKVQTIAYVNMQGQAIYKTDDFNVTGSRLDLPGISTPGLYQVRMIGVDGELYVGRVMVVEKQ